MKKTYIEPNLKVVRIDAKHRFLQGSVVNLKFGGGGGGGMVVGGGASGVYEDSGSGGVFDGYTGNDEGGDFIYCDSRQSLNPWEEW